MTPQVGLILLAAGGATRMGRPKQLLIYRGQTMLRRAAEAAVASGLEPIIAVLGANAEEVGLELDGLPVLSTVNVAWERGIGTSIRTGIATLQSATSAPRGSSASTSAPQLSGVVLMLCDQPLVSPVILRELANAHRQTGKPVIASAYDHTVGVPAVFARSCFPQLAALGDDEGAKRLITTAQNMGCFYAVPFPGGGVDLDTPEDYKRFLLQTTPAAV